MIGLFLKAVILMGIVWLVDRKNTELEFAPMFLIALAISVASLVLTHLLGEALGVFVLVPVAVVAALLVIRFCYVTVKQGVLIAVLFLAAGIAVHLALLSLMSS